MTGPKILQRRELDNQAYYLIRCYEQDEVAYRIQVYAFDDEGEMIYQHGQSFADQSEATDTFEQIVHAAEQTMLQDFDEQAMWSAMHYGR